MPRRSWVRKVLGLDRQRKEKGCWGITLIELMVILAIVLTLASLGIIAYTKYRDNANMAHAIADIRAIEHDIYIYEGYATKLPDSLDQVGKDVLLDPWGNRYQYYNTQTGSGDGQQRFDKLGNLLNTDFDLYSVGKDGMTAPGLDKPESQDDIVRANNGEFAGVASEY
jgi:general secretion pathway protein G